MKLTDRVAMVTGAGQWIGRAIALRLAEEGADVVVDDIHIERACQVADEIRGLGRQALGIEADVSKSQEVNRMAKAALDEFGKVDILVNNAGGSAKERSSLFCESNEEVWDYVIGRNLKGVMNCSRALIEHMMERKGGKIINISSVSGMVGTPGVADYCAAKAGIIGFTMALAKEVASYGINVNCVSPGPIGWPSMPPERIEEDIKQTGMGRIGKPEEIAAMVAFLASDDANFITGENIAVCGLRKLGYYSYFKR